METLALEILSRIAERYYPNNAILEFKIRQGELIAIIRDKHTNNPVFVREARVLIYYVA